MEFEQNGRLSDRHIIVTGGARRIGRGIAVRCARADADLSIFDTRPDVAGETAQAVEATGSDAAVFQVDVLDETDVADAVADARDELGPIHGLVNNVGIQQSIPLLETSLADWERHFDVNAKGAFVCANEVVQAMIEDNIAGSVVNVASVGAEQSFRGQGAYGASKAAVLALTIVQAKEFSDHGITANAIKRGTIETPMSNSGSRRRPRSTV